MKGRRVEATRRGAERSGRQKIEKNWKTIKCRGDRREATRDDATPTRYSTRHRLVPLQLVADLWFRPRWKIGHDPSAFAGTELESNNSPTEVCFSSRSMFALSGSDVPFDAQRFGVFKFLNESSSDFHQHMVVPSPRARLIQPTE